MWALNYRSYIEYTFSDSPNQSVAFPTRVLAVEVSVRARRVQTAHFNSLISGFGMLIFEAVRTANYTVICVT